MRYFIKKKKNVNECDCGGASAPMSTLNNVGGVGNPQPAQACAMTAAEQSSQSCIGSGDKFGSAAPVSTQEPKKKRKYVLKRKPNPIKADKLKY